MTKIFDDFERSFDQAQQTFDGQIDTTDRSQLVVPGNQEDALNFLLGGDQSRVHIFHRVEIGPDLLRDNPDLVINRALLIGNQETEELWPVVITPHPSTPGKFQITRFDLPYDPEVGFSPGMHWMLSLKSQSRAKGFGEHGPKASGLEQGHFGAAILGAYDEAIGQKIIERGDQGTHSVVLNEGVPEVMGKKGMLPIKLKTFDLDPSDPKFTKLDVFWHDKLQDHKGPLCGDFPGATRLMLGAGLHVIDKSGTIKLKGFVNEAVRGV